MQSGNLALKIQFGITRIAAVLRGNNSFKICKFLSNQLIGACKNQEPVVLYCIVSRGKGSGF